jgi:hypothetical protein
VGVCELSLFEGEMHEPFVGVGFRSHAHEPTGEQNPRR